MSFISKILATSVLYFSLKYVSVDCDQHPISLLRVIHKDIDVVWCVSYHWCGLMSSVSQKGPILWSLLSDFNQQHNVLYLVHVFMLLKWNVENLFLLSCPLNYCCMLWLTCGAGEWCMHRKTACDKGRMSGGGGFQQTVLHVTLIISYTHVFMYIQRNSCTHKVSPGSGWSFLY